MNTCRHVYFLWLSPVLLLPYSTKDQEQQADSMYSSPRKLSLLPTASIFRVVHLKFTYFFFLILEMIFLFKVLSFSYTLLFEVCGHHSERETCCCNDLAKTSMGFAKKDDGFYAKKRESCELKEDNENIKPDQTYQQVESLKEGNKSKWCPNTPRIHGLHRTSRDRKP